jgi:antitoxin MazE
MQVSKWGNSLAVRLPASVVEALKLKEGDKIEIRIAGRRKFEIERDRAAERARAVPRARASQLAGPGCGACDCREIPVFDL